MKIPDGRTPEEFNWADYCDALWTESFMQSKVKQQSAQDKAICADHVKSVKTHFDFHAPDKSNWADYCDALRNEGFAQSIIERSL